VGGSVGVSALIVGTVLIALLAAGTVSLMDTTRTATEVTFIVLPDGQMSFVNASHNGTHLNLNLTNEADDPVNLDEAYLTFDGDRILPVSAVYTASEYIFPGEVIHISITISAGGAPARVSVSAWGHSSAMAVS